MKVSLAILDWKLNIMIELVDKVGLLLLKFLLWVFYVFGVGIILSVILGALLTILSMLGIVPDSWRLLSQGG